MARFDRTFMCRNQSSYFSQSFPLPSANLVTMRTESVMAAVTSWNSTAGRAWTIYESNTMSTYKSDRFIVSIVFIVIPFSSLFFEQTKNGPYKVLLSGVSLNPPEIEVGESIGISTAR